MGSHLDNALALVFIATLYLSFDRRYLSELRQSPALCQRCLVAVACLMLLWSINATLIPELPIHFLGITCLVLMFGWRRSVLLAGLAALLSLSAGLLPLGHIGIFLVLGLLLPITSAYLTVWLVDRKLPKHLFIYIFVGAFLNGGLVILLKQVAVAAGTWLAGELPWGIIVDNYLVIAPLLVFPEALLNGMAISMMAVYRPRWLVTFDEKAYLG